MMNKNTSRTVSQISFFFLSRMITFGMGATVLFLGKSMRKHTFGLTSMFFFLTGLSIDAVRGN
jgi:hypothetical protein